MVVSNVEENFLIDYATVSFFIVFSSLYFINRESVCVSSLINRIVELFKSILMWSIVAIVLFGIIVSAMWAFSADPYIPSEYQWRNSAAVVLILASAMFEETLVRGYLLTILHRYTPFITAGFISSLIFALFHAPFAYGFVQFASHFAFGMLMCALFFRFRSLIPGIVIHSIFNYCIGSSYLSFEMAKEHPGVVHFQSATRTEMFLILQTIVLLAAVIFMLRREKPKFFDR